MPIYGYRCGQCGHELEVLQSMSAEPLRVCPECSGVLRKMLYPVGVHFKGSGFYSTDYKNGGSAKSAAASKAEDGGSGESSSSSSSGSEAKSGTGSGLGDSNASAGSSSEKKKAESPPAAKE
jgi:putative FmdB family regulatory protein